MSFVEEFKSLLDMVEAANGVGEGQVAYAVAAKAVEMLAEGLLEVGETAGTCSECKFNIAAETSKLIAQLEEMKTAPDPMCKEPVVCEDCKGTGRRRSLTPGGTRVIRVSCSFCEGSGKR